MSSHETNTELRLLIDRAVGGEASAFDDLIGSATTRLQALAHSMLRRYPQVRRWEDTDDVLQGTLMRLHRSLGEVRPRSTREFYGLAVTQIRRCLIDLLRHYHGPLGQGANHHSRGGGKAADDSGGPIADADANNGAPDSLAAWTAFHESIDELPEEEKEVFTLIWYGGLQRRDVAKLLGVSDKTVMRRFNRARLILQDALESGPQLSLN